MLLSLRLSGAAGSSLITAGMGLAFIGWNIAFATADCESIHVMPIMPKTERLIPIAGFALGGGGAALSRQSYSCSRGTLCTPCANREPICCTNSASCVPGQGCVPKKWRGCAKDACGTGRTKICPTQDACPANSRLCKFCSDESDLLPQCCTGSAECVPTKGCVPQGWNACVDNQCTNPRRNYRICSGECCGSSCCQPSTIVLGNEGAVDVNDPGKVSSDPQSPESPGSRSPDDPSPESPVPRPSDDPSPESPDPGPSDGKAPAKETSAPAVGIGGADGVGGDDEDEKIGDEDNSDEGSSKAPGEDNGNGTCVDSRWLHRVGVHPVHLVHKQHLLSQVLCPSNSTLPCATPSHVVSMNGVHLTYRDLCKRHIQCVHRKMAVNSVFTHRWRSTYGSSFKRHSLEGGTKVTLTMYSDFCPFWLQETAHFVLETGRVLSLRAVSTTLTLLAAACFARSMQQDKK